MYISMRQYGIKTEGEVMKARKLLQRIQQKLISPHVN